VFIIHYGDYINLFDICLLRISSAQTNYNILFRYKYSSLDTFNFVNKLDFISRSQTKGANLLDNQLYNFTFVLYMMFILSNCHR